MNSSHHDQSYTIVKDSDANRRQISAHKSATNYITKEISTDVSLAVLEAADMHEEESTEYDRIYYVLEGEMKLTIHKNTERLTRGDACHISRGTTYTLAGTYKAIVINSPAFGSKTDHR